MATRKGTDNGETITGTEANDILLGLGGNDILYGGDGRDRLSGGDGNDILYGQGGNDTMLGGSGNDTIYARDADTIDGGAGDDLVVYDGVVVAGTANGGGGTRDVLWFHNAFFDAQSGTASFAGIELFQSHFDGQVLIGSDNADTIDLSSLTATRTTSGDLAVVQIYGGDGDDTITGSAARDEIHGQGGNDRIDGGLGNDTIYARDADTINGGAGDDLIVYENVVVAGTANGGGGTRDVLWLHNAFFDAQSGTASFVGIELFQSHFDGQRLFGSEGADTINLSSLTATRTTNGDLAVVEIHGGGGNDRITGGAEQDRIYGGVGRDILNGGDGNDVIYAEEADIIDGGEGNDLIIYERTVLGGTASGGNGEADVIWFHGALFNQRSGTMAFSGIEFFQSHFDGQSILGSAAADWLDLSAITATRTTNNDIAVVSINADDGNDIVTGGAERDVINGGAGADRLDGGFGLDTLTGGEGRDVFVFTAGGTGTRTDSADRITDFSQAERDRIDLSAIDANSGRAGDQNFRFIGANGFSGAAGELRYFAQSGSTYVAGDTDGDGVADLMIRLDGTVTLAAADFVLA